MGEIRIFDPARKPRWWTGCVIASGLRTSLGLVRNPEMLMICGVIILVAVAGKWGGAMPAARWCGIEWR